MTEPVFRGEPLVEIIGFVEAQRAAGAREISFRAIDPDLGRGCYAGELVEHAGERYVHRPFRVWVDLAERLRLRLRTPRVVTGADGDAGLIRLVFEPLEPVESVESVEQGDAEAADSAEPAESADATERYGRGSAFARISKLEDADFVIDFADALARTGLGARPRVLDLGVNTGDELALVARVWPDAELVGIDHSASALGVARARYPAGRFVEADLNTLGALGLGRFDLVISLSTLQSPGIDDRELLRRVVQDHLAPSGAVILGLPNSRYVAGEIQYGARMKNFRQPELGLLVKDVAFYRKYLQQHHRRVFVTGKHYMLVTGVAEVRR